MKLGGRHDKPERNVTQKVECLDTAMVGSCSVEGTHIGEFSGIGKHVGALLREI